VAIKDDLVLLFDQDGRELVNNSAATSTTGTATHTQTVSGASRTVRGYGGAPYGSTINDRIRAAATNDFSGGAQSVFAWIFVDSAGVGNSYGRIIQKGAGFDYHELMCMNNAATSMACLRRSGTGGQYFAIPVVTGEWQLVGYTSDNTTLGANPAGVVGYRNGSSVTLVTPFTTSGVVASATAQYDIGNRSDGVRVFDGMIWQIAVFDRVLTPAEVADLYTDWGQLTGGASLVGSANAWASASADLTTNAQLSATATAQATASATLEGGPAIDLAGSAAAQADASATLNGVTIYDTADRGTLNLASCTVTPNGSTPTIFIRNMYSWEENASGARNCFFHLTGVNGLRPVIDVDRSNMQLSGYTGKFKFSYTGERGTWIDFTSTTRVTSPNVYRSQHADAFTQDTVYVSMANPWRIAYTLPWIQSLESSGFVSYAPSGGASYQFETRSAAVDHLGTTISAQPLYSFKVSSGAGNAPDGNPKRKLVMIAGTHAAEDIGNYTLKGAVEFLVSADPLAVSVRAWFDAFVYPVIASAGRAGGAQRGDFQAGSMSADVNRAWDDTPVLEAVTKHKAAVLADVGATIDVFIDFHGDNNITGDYDFFEGVAGDPYGAKWDAAIDTHQATSINYDSSTDWTTSWAKNVKSSPFSITAESGYAGEWTPAGKEPFGAAHIKAIGTLIAQGEWGTVPLVAAASSTASAAATLTTGIPLAGAAVGISTAAGDLTAQVSLSGDALAQATAAANLTAGAGGLSGDAAAQSAAAASLTTDIHLGGAAVAQAVASADFYGQVALPAPDTITIASAAAGRGRRSGYLYGHRHGIKIAR
jgi:hypothetical protein